MLLTLLMLAFGLSLLVPVTGRIAEHGEGGTLAAVTLTVLAVIAVFAVFG
ncbi:MAG TPA: hypothetical protein VHL53_13320 [Acidimicrobiia bacterium]|nr:hypothetical protein [Acidimicrobiia bacterium]